MRYVPKQFSAALLFSGMALVALGAIGYGASPVVNETVAIVDPSTPSRQATVTASNTLAASPSAAVSGGASFLNIAAGQATTTVKSGAGTLYAIVFNGPATATNTTTVYDNTAASGTVIAIPLATATSVPTTLHFGPTGLAFSTGLTVITATANGANMTFVYK